MYFQQKKKLKHGRMKKVPKINAVINTEWAEINIDNI
jgi:hypothetical protein